MCAKSVKNRNKRRKPYSNNRQKPANQRQSKPLNGVQQLQMQLKKQNHKPKKLQPKIEPIPVQSTTEDDPVQSSSISEPVIIATEVVKDSTQSNLLPNGTTEENLEDVEAASEETSAEGATEREPQTDQKSVKNTEESQEKPSKTDQRSEKSPAEDMANNNVVGRDVQEDKIVQADKHSAKRHHKLFPLLWWLLGAILLIGAFFGTGAALGWFGDIFNDTANTEVEPPRSEDLDSTPDEPEEKPAEPSEPEPTPDPEPEPPKTTESSDPPIAPRPADNTHPSVDTGHKVIALTFDDGPSATTTPRLLDILQSKDVKATFFVLGTMAQRSPEILQREAAEGHEVASHTPYHNQLTNLSFSQVRAEALEMDRIFTEILGTVPPFTRPPYGAQNATVGEALGQPMILWSIDPRDWQDRNASTVCTRVLNAARDGAIILVHDIHSTTVDAVPCIVDNLKAQGYEFLTVSELAHYRDTPLISGAAYYSF